jgi:hypothetical protein
MITRKTTRIIGIGLTVISLSLFFIFHNQGLTGQKIYSGLGCIVTSYQMPESCNIANNQILFGFVGMIFSFFTALFGASLVVPSTLMKLIKRMKKEWKEQ